MRHSRIADLRAGQEQLFQGGQLFQRGKAGIGHLGLVEAQRFQLPKPEQFLETGVGDRLFRELDRPQVGQGGDLFQVGIGQRGVQGVNGNRHAGFSELHGDAQPSQGIDLGRGIRGRRRLAGRGLDRNHGRNAGRGNDKELDHLWLL